MFWETLIDQYLGPQEKNTQVLKIKSTTLKKSGSLGRELLRIELWDRKGAKICGVSVTFFLANPMKLF